MKQDVNWHDRMDMLMHTEEYTDAKCGSLNAQTGKPAYCSFECPTLKAVHTAPVEEKK